MTFGSVSTGIFNWNSYVTTDDIKRGKSALSLDRVILVYFQLEFMFYLSISINPPRMDFTVVLSIYQCIPNIWWKLSYQFGYLVESLPFFTLLTAKYLKLKARLAVRK